MILKRKLTHKENAMTECLVGEYVIRYCEKDGIYKRLKSEKDQTCPYCEKECEEIENIEELQEKYSC